MKKISLLTVLLVCANIVFSQEIAFKLGAGLSAHNHKSDQVSSKLQPCGHLGVSYTHLFGEHIGVLSGLEYGFYKIKNTLTDNVYTSYLVDSEGSAFEYRVNTEGYEESGNFGALAIPLMLHYRFGEKYKFYINGGVKFIIPQKLHKTSNAEKVVLSGYYPDKDIVIENVPKHGFGTVSGWEIKSDVEQKSTVTLSFESGMYFAIKEKSRLYAGLYLDYGLTDMNKSSGDKEKTSLIEYSPDGIENAKSNSASFGSSDKIHLLAFGIQVKYAFDLRKKQKEKPEEVVEMQKVEKEEEPVVKEEVAVEKNVDTVKTEEPKPIEKEEVAAKDTAENIQKEVVEPAEKITKEEKLQIEGVRVSVNPVLGSTALTAQARKDLDKIAKIMKKNPEIKLEIIGHTCDIGSKEANYRIGMKRAKVVSNYFVSKGISRNRLKEISKGKDQPLVPNTSEANRLKNRRIEFKVVE